MQRIVLQMEVRKQAILTATRQCKRLPGMPLRNSIAFFPKTAKATQSNYPAHVTGQFFAVSTENTNIIGAWIWIWGNGPDALERAGFKLVRKIMTFAFKTRHCVMQTRNLVSKTRNFVLEMMNFAGQIQPHKTPAHKSHGGFIEWAHYDLSMFSY